MYYLRALPAGWADSEAVCRGHLGQWGWGALSLPAGAPGACHQQMVPVAHRVAEGTQLGLLEPPLSAGCHLATLYHKQGRVSLCCQLVLGDNKFKNANVGWISCCG